MIHGSEVLRETNYDCDKVHSTRSTDIQFTRNYSVLAGIYSSWRDDKNDITY
jgi:hypothetical protein